MLDLTYTKIDKNLPDIKKATNESIGIDVYSRLNLKIKPKEFYLIPLNIIIKTNAVVLLVPRSSLFLKKGLIVVNSPGIIDNDFSGPEDELKLAVYNLKNEVSFIKKGERIAQLILLDKKDINIVYKEKHWQKHSRGGFGSTDDTFIK